MHHHRKQQPPGPVENYTDAFLWSAGVALFMGLFVLWAVFGYAAPLVAGFVLRLGIDLLARRG